MPSKIIPIDKSTKMLSPHELAKKFEREIKEAIVKRFSVNGENLSILMEDKDGVYWSQEKPRTLCCLVVNKKDGFLYLVAAKFLRNGKELNNFKCDIIS